MAKVSFRREVLVSTKQYENQKIVVEREEDVKEGERADLVFENIRRWVDNKIADQIVAIRLGIDNVRIQSESKRRADTRKAVIRERGLFADEDISEADRYTDRRFGL